MPNWTSNILTLSGEPKEIAIFVIGMREFIRSTVATLELPTFTFRYIVPDNENLSGQELIDWRYDAWGTKWDACNSEYLPMQYTDGDTSVTYQFDTAWAAPLPILHALAASFPGFDITLEYQYEGEEDRSYTFSIARQGEYNA